MEHMRVACQKCTFMMLPRVELVSRRTALGLFLLVCNSILAVFTASNVCQTPWHQASMASDLMVASSSQRRVQLVMDNSANALSDIPKQSLSVSPPLLPPPPQPLPRPVRLLRIPKAGSSSFSAFLRLQYDCTSDAHPPGDCTRHNRGACPAVQGCTNHEPIPHWQNNDINNTPAMVTFVRDPLARYRSAYRYPGHHGLGTNGNITRHVILFPEYNNVQTNYLSRHAIGTWNVRHGNRARSVPPPNHSIANDEWQRRLQTASSLINATQHLAFVGLVEYWNDSLRLFCRMYQCTRLDDSLLAQPERQQQKLVAATTITSTKRSVAESSSSSSLQPKPKSPSRPDQHHDDAVRHANAIDLQLYEIAVTRFCHDLARYQSDEIFVASLQPETLLLCFERGSSAR
jgi:Sulfotransferase family